MDTLKKLIILLLFLTPISESFSQAIDTANGGMNIQRPDTTTAISNNDEIDIEDDFAPGLFFIALLGLVFMVVGIGFSIALTFLIILLIAGLASMGVLTTAIFIGIHKKSLTAGFRTFVILGSTFGGVFLGGASFWLYNTITHWWTVEYAVMFGGLMGLLAGVLFGYATCYILQRLTSYFKKKFQS
ncbi:MAG: hypothetical protein IPP71_04065 [Bacteroidetes bacterium]|nr:hypothetical protein [Bacteroidota bacterium]